MSGSMHGKLKLSTQGRPSTKSSLAEQDEAAEASSKELAPGASNKQPLLKALVGYKDAGAKPLNAAEQRVFTYILTHYNIPADLEVNKTRYGPLSGQTYEERVVSAYEHGLLDAFRKPPAGKAGASAGGASAVLAPVSLLGDDEATRDAFPGSSATQSLPSTPARGPAGVIVAGGAAGAIEVTPQRAGAAIDIDPVIAGQRLAMCYECGADGHWRWECDERLK